MNNFMETIRFFSPKDFATFEMLQTVHLVALDRSLVPVQAELDENQLAIHYPQSENLRFGIPWTIPNFGNKMLTTGTLAPTQNPYWLSIELARGLCASIRNQASDWETLGLVPSEEFWNTIQDAGRYLFHAIKLSYNQEEYDPEIDKYANYSMQLCMKASILLARTYIERILLLRKLAQPATEAAIALKKELDLEYTTEKSLIEQEDNFDEDRVSQMLMEMETSDTLGTMPDSGNTQDSSLYDAPLDISDDDTAIHIVEAVPPKYIGVHLDYNILEKETKDIFFQTFNHVNISVSWPRILQRPEILNEYDQQIDWCVSNGFSVTAGPILNFFPAHLPDMLTRYIGNYEVICDKVRDYVSLLVKRYRNRVSTWVATSRVNTYFPLGLSLLQQLDLTIKIVGWIHEFQPTAEVLTSLDMPWGDNVLPPPYGVEDEDSREYPTIICADYLLRSRNKINGFQLEFNIGYRNLATYDRPLLEWSRLIDRWSHFGVPLYLQIRVPSSSAPDRKAIVSEPPLWNGWTMRYQALWASYVLPILLVKPNVYGVDWCVFRDYRTHDYPNAGLITGDGRVKKAQVVLAEILKYFMTEAD